MLSVRADRPVDPLTVAILHEADRVAVELGLPYFVLGAMARDILITHVHGLDTERATRDIDLAIALDSWDAFETVKERLVATRKFVAHGAKPPRLNYVASGERHGYPVDILPFGGVERDGRTIAWPPDADFVMNVAGYQEALQSAETVQVADGLTVLVVSLPGLAVLKSFAWADRHETTTKDAKDLLTLMRTYGEAGNLDRLYDPGSNIMESVDYDVEQGAARLLGADIRRTMTDQTAAQLIELLATGSLRAQLLTDMLRSNPPIDRMTDAWNDYSITCCRDFTVLNTH